MPQLQIINIRNQIRCDIRMDRQTIFGNPFRMQREADREFVCQCFEEYLDIHPKLMNAFETAVAHLGDKEIVRLGCWCFPRQCHVESFITRWETRRHALFG